MVFCHWLCFFVDWTASTGRNKAAIRCYMYIACMYNMHEIKTRQYIDRKYISVHTQYFAHHMLVPACKHMRLIFGRFSENTASKSIQGLHENLIMKTAAKHLFNTASTYYSEFLNISKNEEFKVWCWISIFWFVFVTCHMTFIKKVVNFSPHIFRQSKHVTHYRSCSRRIMEHQTSLECVQSVLI